MTVTIRRGTDRFVERHPGRQTRHAFSFGEHYDAANLDFGPMVCHDEHVLGAGRGFDTHRHSGLDIVSFVLEGTLVHQHGDGPPTDVPTGSAAIFHPAPDGTDHSEHASSDGVCRFVQVWLRTDRETTPEPEHVVVPVAPVPGELVSVARPQPGAELFALALGTRQTAQLPRAARVHAHLVSGGLTRSSLAEPLLAGDAFLLTDEPAHEVTAGTESLLLVWTFDG